MSAAAWTPKRGRLVVPPLQRKGRSVKFKESRMATTLSIVDGVGNEDSYVRWAATSDLSLERWWRPNLWTSHRVRIDRDGEKWSMAGPHFVMDDFGYLVEVPQ